MARCEDYPCCGHENGCCPDFDDDGRQLNMVCVCGAKLPVDNPSSCCDSCLNRDDEDEDEDEDEEYEYDGQPDWQQEWTDFNGGFEC